MKLQHTMSTKVYIQLQGKVADRRVNIVIPNKWGREQKLGTCYSHYLRNGKV